MLESVQLVLSHPYITFFSILSVAPWGIYIFLMQSTEKSKKFFLIILSILLGILSTYLILKLSPILWPKIDFKPKRSTMLTATAYMAFIQAGMIEEFFKILFMLILSTLFSFNRSQRIWEKDVVLIGAFIAIGFALVENFRYILSSIHSFQKAMETFWARTLISTNLHILINICFGLFLLKSNQKKKVDKFILLIFAFFLAVIQHGILDFFLIPLSKIGTWLAVAFFAGIWVWIVKDMRTYVYDSK